MEERRSVCDRLQEQARRRGSGQSGAGRPSQFSTSAPEHAGQTETHISAGTLPYFLFSAFYDDQRQLVGLKRR
jgi:hypothetical protein